MTYHIARGLLFFVFAYPLVIFADGVTITSSCNLTNYTKVPFAAINSVSQTGAGNCNLSLVNPARGTGSVGTQTFVTLDLPAPGDPGAPVGARISAGSGAFPSTDSLIDPIIQSGSAAISLALDLTFTTAGPPRAGYIQSSQRPSLSVSSSNGGDRPDSQSAGFAVGPLSLTCPGSPGTDVINGCGGSLQAFPGQLVPFSLGENFLFHEEAGLLTATDARPSAIEDGTVNVNYTFRLFEADGVTPVQIALATPEPGSLALSAFGLSALFAFRRKQAEAPSHDI